MIASKNKQVQQFLEDVLHDDENKYAILQDIRALVFSLNGDISERIMYGGIMFTAENDFGGIYKYKNHISFEFGNGFKFEDADSILEGSGEYRRHVKIEKFSDIKDKNIKSFVEQAMRHDKG